VGWFSEFTQSMRPDNIDDIVICLSNYHQNVAAKIQYRTHNQLIRLAIIAPT
jgi:hypothetical protein